LSGTSPASNAIVIRFSPRRRTDVGNTRWPFTARACAEAPLTAIAWTAFARCGSKSTASGIDALARSNVIVSRPVIGA